ncbi:TIGR03086 family protein [Paractinoplanes abujensis]|uniref:Uncharacterized protein (TIGR03086 family) n=1 Tax=Paractinoplanes abujensis TaxID=882441 RepID=A0A7W7G318_9ACTN|nr:TIGR03086 family metal-binding protein [Actinoplanes abujensis]MBB4693700.1 uncharacterized protein (TIGR03086 family) [Actinoplanes abujensis]GID21643.1 TIGR03086 family protein [Actinoplanes abujensis]
MLTIEIDARPADAAAVRGTVDVVARTTDTDLTRPTPCAGWNLATLLTHMTEQHYVFATAAGGRTPSRADLGPSVSASGFAGSSRDIVRQYEESAEAVLTAFAAVDDLDAPFWIPEFGRSVPGRLAIGFHLVDYVVHGWDVARALEVTYAPDPDAVALSLSVARAVPDGPERRESKSPFAPALPVPAGADSLTEILLLLGRDPSRPLS